MRQRLQPCVAEAAALRISDCDPAYQVRESELVDGVLLDLPSPPRLAALTAVGGWSVPARAQRPVAHPTHLAHPASQSTQSTQPTQPTQPAHATSPSSPVSPPSPPSPITQS